VCDISELNLVPSILFKLAKLPKVVIRKPVIGPIYTTQLLPKTVAYNPLTTWELYCVKHTTHLRQLRRLVCLIYTVQLKWALWKPGMPEYHGIWRNITEYAGISRNIPEYHGISRHFPGIYRNITIFSDGSHATVYKHGRLTTYFITKVMNLSHFDGK
jgi:hypothetical protein